MLGLVLLLGACSRRAAEEDTRGEPPKTPSPTAAVAVTPPAEKAGPQLAPGLASASGGSGGPDKVDLQDEAMGTNVHFIAYTTDHVDVASVRAAMGRAP